MKNLLIFVVSIFIVLFMNAKGVNGSPIYNGNNLHHKGIVLDIASLHSGHIMVFNSTHHTIKFLTSKGETGWHLQVLHPGELGDYTDTFYLRVITQQDSGKIIKTYNVDKRPFRFLLFWNDGFWDLKKYPVKG